MPQVALSSDFLKALGLLPRQKQKKVRAFMQKFCADPTQASIDYEPMHRARDSKVHTVRIDQQYRAVVIQPPHGDVYLCVWVDNHDEARAWAQNKMFEVNALTGAFQVWESIEGKAPEPQPQQAHEVAAVSARPIPEERLLSGNTDDVLLLLGVPEPLLPAVRALRTEEDLDQLCKYLPQEASDALYLLAAGYDVDEVIDELDRASREQLAKQKPVDTTDFATALQKSESKRQFKIVEDDHELSEILNAPLEQWRIFLHPSQDRLVRMESKGPSRVLGGAGTGKTVVAMHRARHLARLEGFLQPGERILFTTFTKNLAADISKNLDNLCGPERERIEVTHLHAWARDYLVSRGMQVRVVPDKVQEELWSRICDKTGADVFSPSFYREEWDKVVQAQDITDLAGYLRARRVGRGTALSRGQRKLVWEVLSSYRQKLQERNELEWPDVIRETRLHIANHPGRLPYRTIIADEVQDLRQADLALLRAMAPEAPNDMFLVGDAHQRIYGHQASLGRAGINIRGRRSRRLTLNYRTTQRIRSWAEQVIQNMEIDDLDEGVDTKRGYHSLRVGAAPELRYAEDPNGEAEIIVDTVKRWREEVQGSDICVVARKRALVEDTYRALLENAGIATDVIKTDADRGKPDAVRLATMHRVKGLEFARVILAGMHKEEGPLSLPDHMFADEASKRNRLDEEKRLVYVAATRARDFLVVTGVEG
jgi:superfamily I DNA/RNA helicase/mRNA-degrading endonuclease RelE of RelBE toxin-antitoxin system